MDELIHCIFSVRKLKLSDYVSIMEKRSHEDGEGRRPVRKCHLSVKNATDGSICLFDALMCYN